MVQCRIYRTSWFDRPPFRPSVRGQNDNHVTSVRRLCRRLVSCIYPSLLQCISMRGVSPVAPYTFSALKCEIMPSSKSKRSNTDLHKLSRSGRLSCGCLGPILRRFGRLKTKHICIDPVGASRRGNNDFAAFFHCVYDFG